MSDIDAETADTTKVPAGAFEPVQPPAALVTPTPSLWRNRDYMLLWSGQFVSTVGTGVSQLALPLLILYLTGSPAQAGLAGFLGSLPYVILSLPAGALVDRWNRKTVMIVCDLGRALALGSVPLAWYLGRLSVIQLFGVAMIENALYTFFNLAEVAALPRVVPKEQLPEATGQNQAGMISAFIVAPPLGGFIYQVLGKTIPYLGDAVSYFVSAASLLLINTKFQGERTAQPKSIRADIKEGLDWLWGQPLIRFMAFLTGGFNFVGSQGLVLLLILLAKGQQAPPAAIGLMFSIGAVGGVVGSFLGAPVQKRFGFAQVIIAVTWIQAVLTPLYILAPNPIVLGVLLALTFVVGPIYNVVQVGYRLSIIPDELQGRVNSVFRLIAFGLAPLGSILAGFMAQTIGVKPAVLVFGAWLFLLAIVTSLNGQLRHARPIAGEKQAA